MGENNCWEREVVIIELTKGKELMLQLQTHFDPMKQDVCQYLATEILSSYDKALSLLNGTALSGMISEGKQSINPAPSSSAAPQLESPHLLADNSAKSSDRPSNSRKSAPTSEKDQCSRKIQEFFQNDKNDELKKKKRNDDDDKHPTYRGVRKRSRGVWVSEIRQPKKKSRLWLGTYRTARMAARAHDVAALAIKGRSAYLNFPHLADQYPRPSSASPKNIQEAAAKAAAITFPGENEEEEEIQAEPNQIELQSCHPSTNLLLESTQ